MLTAAEPRTKLSDITALAAEVVEHLRGMRRRLVEEIRSYPTPIPRCDAQFNHLYEQQARLARELDRIAALAEKSLKREDYIGLIEGFIASAPYADDAAERRLRSRLKSELSEVGK